MWADIGIWWSFHSILYYGYLYSASSRLLFRDMK